MQTPQTQARRVYLVLRSGIRAGTYVPNEQLVEEDLVKALGASRNAVRQALRALADDGLIARSPKRGTNVLRHKWNLTLDQRLSREEEDMSVHHPYPVDSGLRAELLERRIVPCPPYVQDRLEIDDDLVTMEEYILHSPEGPVAVRVGYFPRHLDPGPHRVVTRHRSVVFEERFQSAFGYSEDSVEAIACEERTAALLELAVGSPILLVETLSIAMDGEARELSFNYNRGDMATILTSAVAPGPVTGCGTE